MKKLTYILLVLSSSIGVLLSMFLSSIVRMYAFFAICLYLVLLFALASFTRQKYDKYLVLFILGWFVLVRFVFPSKDQYLVVLQGASTAAFICLHLVLLIGPWSRISETIQKRYYYRRHLGITTLLLALLHVSIVVPTFNYSFHSIFLSPFTFYGLTAVSLMFWIGLTSWDEVQKKFSRRIWNILHSFLLLCYLSFAYYFYTVQQTFQNNSLSFHLAMIGIFSLFWIIAAPYSIINRIMNTEVFGWKQFHVLLYIVYGSVILHVSFGKLQSLSLGYHIVFWISITTVVGSHALGWFIRWNEDRTIYRKIASINKKIVENDTTYLGVSTLSELHEGIGQKVYIDKQPVALFKHKGDVIAISDVCAHQKGPLHKGKIAGKYVICPWHFWQYGIIDGRGPPGYHDCIATYNTKIVDGIVYIGSKK